MSSLSISPQDRISRSRIRLRNRAPLLATLALLTRIEAGIYVPAIATNGRDVLCNPEYLEALSAAETDGALLHTFLHAALLHLPRRGDRDPLQWNTAADIVVNGIVEDMATVAGLDQKGNPILALPEGFLQERALSRLTVEEVYDCLHRREPVPVLPYERRDLCDTPDVAPDTLISHWYEVWKIADTFHDGNPRALLPSVMRPEVERVIEELNRCTPPPPREALTLDIEAVQSGGGENCSFPETPAARFDATLTLARAEPEIEAVLHVFRWMIEQAAPEWVQLFAMEMFRKVRDRGKMGNLAQRMHSDPRFHGFMEWYTALMAT